VDNQAAIIAVRDFVLIFTSILYEAMPFIVLGAVVAGILEELVPQRWIVRIVPRNRFLAILIGGLLGILFPMCECGIIPVMRRLLRKGLPLSACISYMLAGPIINVVVIASTYVAFMGMEKTEKNGLPTYQMGGLWMVCMRVFFGYLVAIGTAWIVELQYRKYGNKLLVPLAIPNTAEPDPDDEKLSAKRPWHRRLLNICETALHDFQDIMVYLIIGAAIASVARQAMEKEGVQAIALSYPWLSIAIMMAFAIVLCLCSEADAFVAASFVSIRPASKVAFLVLGPMLDFKLYFMFLRVFRPRLIWTIVFSVVIQVYLYASLLHVIWEKNGPDIYTWEQKLRMKLNWKEQGQELKEELEQRQE
jgi:uncharacterized protein